MSQNEAGSNTGAYPQRYVYETETKLYELFAQSIEGQTFKTLTTGPEKIKFLKEHGKETTKATGGRIMQPEPGAFRFYNEGQQEYMFRGDEGEGVTGLERDYKCIEGLEDKKAFFHENATYIREWPERILRKENLV